MPVKNKQYLLDTNILIDILNGNPEVMVEDIDVHPLAADGKDYAEIKHLLKEQGNMIDDFDIVIAGQAISEGLIVVTDNIKHFNRIEGLKVENWIQR